MKNQSLLKRIFIFITDSDIPMWLKSPNRFMIPTTAILFLIFRSIKDLELASIGLRLPVLSTTIANVNSHAKSKIIRLFPADEITFDDSLLK